MLRLAKGMKLTDLAKATDFSSSFLSLVESGDREPSLTALRTIADGLGVPSDVLLILSDDQEVPPRANEARTETIVDAVSNLLKAEAKLREKLG